MAVESCKSPKVSVEVRPRYNASANKKFCGRLIGIVSDEEARAIVNTPGAAKKIFTTAGISIADVSFSSVGMRLVIATEDYSDRSRQVFISPKIRSAYYSGHPLTSKCFICANGYEYTVSDATELKP